MNVEREVKRRIFFGALLIIDVVGVGLPVINLPVTEMVYKAFVGEDLDCPGGLEKGKNSFDVIAVLGAGKGIGIDGINDFEKCKSE